ncbi:MAG: hypothetical protein F6K48_14045 [Okeania sp. SIO3H1]|nr:hypothetical protein [Okeania sp. SIO3H1]
MNESKQPNLLNTNFHQNNPPKQTFNFRFESFTPLCLLNRNTEYILAYFLPQLTQKPLAKVLDIKAELFGLCDIIVEGTRFIGIGFVGFDLKVDERRSTNAQVAIVYSKENLILESLKEEEKEELRHSLTEAFLDKGDEAIENYNLFCDSAKSVLSMSLDDIMSFVNCCSPYDELHSNAYLARQMQDACEGDY